MADIDRTKIGTMAEVPAGSFLMGSENGADNEAPVREVSLDSFMIDVCPITNEQFKAFIKACPQWQKDAGITEYLNTYYLYIWRQNLIFPNGKRDHPAVYMNWYAAAAYCNWRSRIEGFQEAYDEADDFACNFDVNGYRLPTEAEFEYAARGGLKDALYPWGNEIDKSVANYDNLIGDTCDVMSYAPNGFGLFDMSGNIGHWCQDWYDEAYYKNAPKNNPRGPETGTHKSYRGGSWGNGAELQRVSCRFWQLQVNCNPDFGFRCVRAA